MVQALPQATVGSGQQVNQEAVINVVKAIATEHRELMVSRKEAEIDRQVKVLSNPMSKRAVDHDLRLLDCVSNIKKVLMVGPNLLVATAFNFETINRSLALVLSAVQEVEDRCKSDHAKHLVTHKSTFGWKFVSSLEALEKKVRHIEVSTLRAQDKAYATHVAAMGGDSKWSDSDWLDSGAGSSGTRGRNYEKNKARKAKQKAAKGGKGKEHQV